MKQFLRKNERNSTVQETMGALIKLRACIDDCEHPAASVRKFERLRESIHRAEFLPCIDEMVLKRCRMLDNGKGLPRLFMGEGLWPPDIVEDAFELYVRWFNKIFSNNLLRGLIVTSNNRTTDKIDMDWPGRRPEGARYYGQGHLVQGQWWPTQLTCK